MDVDKIIERIKSFDLKTVPIGEIRAAIEELKLMAIMRVKLPAGQAILRGRVDSVYTYRRKEEEISYIHDPKVIPQYNRASLEGNSLFYGVLESGDFEYCKSITVYEITTLEDENLEPDKDVEEYITMARWILQKDIYVAAIANHQEFQENNPYLKNLNEGFIKFVSEYPESKDTYINIAEYLSGEFAKAVKNNERYLYKISALFSQMAIEYGLDGIMYPTAKDQGKAFNVAIKPSAVDECFRIEKAVVFRVIRRNKNILIDPFLYSESVDNQNEFVWKDPGTWTSEGIANKILNRE